MLIMAASGGSHLGILLSMPGVWGLSFVTRTVSVQCWGLSGRMLCYSECFLLLCVLCSALVLGSWGGLLELLSQVPWYLWYQASVKYYGTHGTMLVIVGFPRPCFRVLHQGGIY